MKQHDMKKSIFVITTVLLNICDLVVDSGPTAGNASMTDGGSYNFSSGKILFSIKILLLLSFIYITFFVKLMTSLVLVSYGTHNYIKAGIRIRCARAE